MKKATLKYPNASFDSALYEPDRLLDTHLIELLAKGEWIDEPKNLLITGEAGAGKVLYGGRVFLNRCGRNRLLLFGQGRIVLPFRELIVIHIVFLLVSG